MPSKLPSRDISFSSSSALLPFSLFLLPSTGYRCVQLPRPIQGPLHAISSSVYLPSTRQTASLSLVAASLSVISTSLSLSTCLETEETLVTGVLDEPALRRASSPTSQFSRADTPLASFVAFAMVARSLTPVYVHLRLGVALEACVTFVSVFTAVVDF